MKFLIAIIFLILFASCTNTARLDNLKLKNNKYYNNDSNIPFTGIAKGYFKSGELSSEINFEKGIPIGKSIGYGYDGEKINQGMSSVIRFSEKKPYLSDVLRINLDKWYELPSRPFNSIVFITVSPSKIDIVKYKNEITEMLRKDKFINGTDTLFTISVARGELENPNK